jgi:hypothetical protein
MAGWVMGTVLPLAAAEARSVHLSCPVRGRYPALKGSETMAFHDRPDIYDRHDAHDRHDVYDRPAVHERHDVHVRPDAWRVERMLLTAAALIFAVSCMFLVMWLAMSEQKTKLYEADNIVCASQPFAMNCWERKPR